MLVSRHATNYGGKISALYDLRKICDFARVQCALPEVDRMAMDGNLRRKLTGMVHAGRCSAWTPPMVWIVIAAAVNPLIVFALDRI